MCPINKTGIHNTFEGVEYVFFLKGIVWQPSDFWTLHSPYVGGLVWLMDQVTWNLPDLNGARKAESCAVSSAAVQAALSPGPMRTQWADQRHQLSGHNRHSEISLLSNRKYTRETSGCSRGDMAALSWRDCGAWAALVRRKEEAVGGCPSDALTSVYKERTQCLWLRASWLLSQGSKVVSSSTHTGVSSSSRQHSWFCPWEAESLYTVQGAVSFLLKEIHLASPGSSLMMVARSQLNLG